MVRIAPTIVASILAGALALVAASTVSAVPGTCPGDVNGDGWVDLSDMHAVSQAFGTTGTQAGPADVNGDGIVDTLDLNATLDNLGPCGTTESDGRPPGKPLENWIVAVLNGNAADRAMGAVSTNH